MASPDDLSWVDALNKEIAAETPPSYALSHSQLVDQTGLETSKLHRKMKAMVASGKFLSMRYKRQRFYWPNKGGKK
jgi:hypothetical protein